MRHILLGLVLTAATATTAVAGTVTGTIRNSGGAGLSGMQVRAWSQNAKGWQIAATTTTNGSGVYSITVADGDYLVDARMPPGVSGNYGDRYYDVAAPTSGGYVQDSADVIAVSGTVSGIDITLEVMGGADGTVNAGGLRANVIVRLERNADPRIHHNDVTDGSPHLGEYFFRGMPPATDYRYLAYDPSGAYELRIYNGPYTITANNVASAPAISMSAAAADPGEPNNSPSCGSTIDLSTTLRQEPPQRFSTGNARIAPRGSDADWYCIDAVDGDRFLVSTSTEVNIGGTLRDHPWTDPIVAFWAGQGITKIAEDDDSGSGYNASFDTGPLTAGCHCFSVSTFGDPDYNGSGAGSSGRYRLDVDMGNRPPVVSIRKGNSEVPAAPGMLVIAEGETLDLNLSYGDADGDPVTPSFSHTDSGDAGVTTGTLNLGAASGDYSWDVPSDGANGSPYTITLQAVEAEFTMSKTITVVVTAVNDPPSVPVPVSPIAGAVVPSGSPDLVWMNATDPDSTSVSYDVEVYYGGTDGVPDQSRQVAEDASGMTTMGASPIPENTRVNWRVRARDDSGALSPWSAFEGFLVDSANDAPETPILTKPGNFEIVFARRPGLSVINVADPEDDPIDFIFEIATDGNFNDVVWTSAAVPMNDVSGTTMTVATSDLEWGEEYWARAMARDARGGESDWSNVRQFRLAENTPPGTPAWDGGCQILEFNKSLPESVVVNNVEDLEGEEVTFELEFFFIEDDPSTAAPVLRATAVQNDAGTTTEIPFDAEMLDNGHYRYRVRAFDGTDYSDWIECEMILSVEGNAGGCCRTSSSGSDLALALAVLALVAVRRRRRD